MSQSRKRSNIVPTSIDPRAKNALKYKPEYCDAIVAYSKDGEFPEEWCAKMGISMSTMYNWANRYEDFDHACKLAWTYLSAYWTRETVKAARGGPGNVKVLTLILRKRFPDTWGKNATNSAAHLNSLSANPLSERKSDEDSKIEKMSIEEILAELEVIRLKRESSVKSELSIQ